MKRNQASAVQIEESEISGVHEPEDETKGAVLTSHIEGEKKVTLNNPELGVEYLTAVECEAVTLQSDDITNCSSTLNQTIPRNQIRGVTVSNPEDHKCEQADISPETLEDSRVAGDNGASPSGIPQQQQQQQQQQPEEVCDDPLMVQTSIHKEEEAPEESSRSPLYSPAVGSDVSPISCSSTSLS